MRRARWDSRPVVCRAKVLSTSRRPRSTEIGFRTFHVLSCAEVKWRREMRLTLTRPVAATTLAVTVMLLAPIDAQAEHACKNHGHVGAARGWSVARVRNNAVKVWEQQARIHDGPDWAKFATACDASLICRRFPGRVQCTARGRPGAIR